MRKTLLWALVGVSVVGSVMAMLHGPIADSSDRLWALTWMAWPLVGGVILLRKPRNRIGIACLAIGLVWGVSFALQSIVLDISDSAASWIELTYTMLGVVPWMIIVWLLANFPTGEPAGRLERFVSRSLWVIGGWAVLGFAVDPASLTDTGLRNPLGVVSSPVFTIITGEAGFMVVVILGVLAVISLVLRLRRSSGIERLQYRWLLLGGSLFVGISALGQFMPEDSAGELLWLLGGSAIPISIGVAVIRYRLFEIDRLLSRTVGYVVVVVMLGALYFAVVAVLTAILSADSSLAVAGSTLAVAALFNPLRRRVLAGVDRRFNRSRYDAERVMSGFTGSLRDEVDPERVVGGWVSVVAETMQPAAAGVWVKER
ncbi:MAG TPA: hypothetical protein VFP42_08440 [Acidimicrobiia bacterium]|nr:hypothetical protein [Acidimicrobiia bacterium]